MRRSVLITGGARGIGEGIVRKFYDAGWDTAFCYRRSEEAAAALCREMPGLMSVRADVSQEAEVSRMTELVTGAFGRIDALVCNAGEGGYGLLQDVLPEEFDRLFAVNVRGVYLCCRAVLPDMIRRQSGSIVTVSSMWGQVGGSCEAVYSAAKGAVIALTKALAREVGPSGIRVNSVSPGTVVTDMTRWLGEETLEALREETPLGVLGTPQDVAEAVFFLAGDNAKYITGQVLGVNGGFVT